MKTFIIAFTMLFSIQFKAHSQATVPFNSCPGSNVLVYKDGTNCTESPYNFYNLDLAGNISSFGSPTVTGIEINAIGINSVDHYLYGLQYVRTGTSSPCTFANTHLIRMDAAGNMDDLGALTPPSGGTISNAFGAISSDGNFIFYATISGNISIGSIPFVQLLSAGGSINPNYISITNNCPGKSIADWAINPLDGNIYSYATFPETIGATTYMRGVVIKIDLISKTFNCVGAINTTELFDPLRDNFGGVMFGSDNFMYAVNINTRKFYKIDVTNGNLTLVKTFAGSGNMRGDLGSCASASIVLPVKLSSFSATIFSCLNILKWKLEDPTDVQSQTIMKSIDGKNFTDFFTVNNNYTETFADEKSNTVNTYYRLKLTEKNGGVNFSDIKLAHNNCNQVSMLKIMGNPLKNKLLALYETNNNKQKSLEILDASGKRILNNGTLLTYSFGKINANIERLTKGIYFLKVTENDGKVVVERFIKN